MHGRIALPGDDVSHALAAVHELLLTDLVGVVCPCALAGGNALSGGSRGVLGCVLQPLDHLSLHRRRNGHRGGVPQRLGGSLQRRLVCLVGAVGTD